MARLVPTRFITYKVLILLNVQDQAKRGISELMSKVRVLPQLTKKISRVGE
jgi:hypothetical protein